MASKGANTGSNGPGSTMYRKSRLGLVLQVHYRFYP